MMPLPSKRDSVVKLISIDPGSDRLGVAIYEIDAYTLEIKSILAKTYIGNKIREDNWITDVHGDRIQRIQAHAANLSRLLNKHDPVAVICESPFISMRRPQAYGALMEVITMLRLAVMEYSPWLSFHLVDPPTAKNAVGAKGNADKAAILKALKEHPEIPSRCLIPIECLDEHSCDAIAIGYHLLLSYRHRIHTGRK